jgi:hypothetical protein
MVYSHAHNIEDLRQCYTITSNEQGIWRMGIVGQFYTVVDSHKYS